jgi:hypothetical protein
MDAWSLQLHYTNGTEFPRQTNDNVGNHAACQNTEEAVGGDAHGGYEHESVGIDHGRTRIIQAKGDTNLKKRRQRNASDLVR